MPTAAKRHKQATHRISAITGEPITESRPLTTAEKGYAGVWPEVRANHLATHPLCVHCLAATLITAATEVDHRIPHNGNRELLLDPENLQSLCKPCHTTKTQSERR